MQPSAELIFLFFPVKYYVFLPLMLAGSAYACWAGGDPGGMQLGHAAHFGGAAVGMLAGTVLRRARYRSWR